MLTFYQDQNMRTCQSRNAAELAFCSRLAILSLELARSDASSIQLVCRTNPRRIPP